MLLSTGKKVGRVVSYSADIGCGFLQYISSTEQVFFGVDQNLEIAKQAAPESGEGCLFEVGQKNSGEACAVNVLLLRGTNAERMLQMSASFPPYTAESATANGSQQQQQQQQPVAQNQEAKAATEQPAKPEPKAGSQQELQQQLLKQLEPPTQSEPAQQYM